MSRESSNLVVELVQGLSSLSETGAIQLLQELQYETDGTMIISRLRDRINLKGSPMGLRATDPIMGGLDGLRELEPQYSTVYLDLPPLFDETLSQESYYNPP